MPVTVQASTEQDQAEKEKRATSKSKLDFSGAFVCLSVGGVCFCCCCLKAEGFQEKGSKSFQHAAKKPFPKISYYTEHYLLGFYCCLQYCKITFPGTY